MTNYNERLDNVLRDHRGRVLICYELFRRQHHNSHWLDEDLSHTYAVAKQAITSLIKELVAEAKPARAVISDDEMGIDRARKSAANSAIDHFEQNLLKGLEEKK